MASLVRQSRILPTARGIKYTKVEMKEFPTGSRVRLVKTGFGLQEEAKMGVGTVVQARQVGNSRTVQVAIRMKDGLLVFFKSNLRKPRK